MCARRFLILIFILTLIVVGGAFALFQFGGEVLIKQATRSAIIRSRPGPAGRTMHGSMRGSPGRS